jgi:HSP20 family molecular chaperone IbpA
MDEKPPVVQRAPEQTALKVVEPKTLFERINHVREAIAHRAFEIFEKDGGFFGHDVDHWLKAEAELLHPVHVTVTESGNVVELEAEVPGFSSKDLEVSVEPGRVTISGSKHENSVHKTGKVVYSEQCSDELLRVIDLPANVDASRATATLKDGVLALNLPKAAAQAKTTKIEVKAA